jgi:hypothetical protein
VQKFSFDKFALCVASPDECMIENLMNLVKTNESRRQQTAQPASNPSTATARKPSSEVATPEAASASATPGKVETYLLRVHLYSTIEVKQTTVLKVLSNTLLSDVFEQICEKRKYNSADYVLRMADTKTDVPLDKTLEQLKVMEFCVLKRDRGGAGDIFLRPPDESKPDDLPRFISADEYSVYKVFIDILIAAILCYL